MKQKMYERSMGVCFSIAGNFNQKDKGCIEHTNDFLRQFRKKLEAFEVREGDIFIRVNHGMVDNFTRELLSPTLLLCSHSIKFTITDNEVGWADRANSYINPLLAEKLRALSFDNGQRDEKSLSVKVEALKFVGQPKVGRWPQERVLTISF